MRRGAAVLFTLLLTVQGVSMVGAAVAAMPENLLLPLDCTLGQDCWVVRYVDHDPGPGVMDYTCGGMTGDKHNGTDFAIRDLGAMASGVLIKAAAAGKVSAVRDGMEDRLIDAGTSASVGGRECGNGVRIDHGDGWFTLYCHMRRGSPLVKEGDDVIAGQPLGLIGLSGQTSFPHLHFDLRHHEQAVDPFTGPNRTSACGAGKAGLWHRAVVQSIDKRPPLLTNSGITTSVPEKVDLRKGWHRARALPTTSPSLTLWVDGYWFEKGDVVRFLLIGPDERVIIDRQFDVGSDHQRWFSFASAPRPSEGWPGGWYQGEVQVQRAGTTIRDVVISTVEIQAVE